MENNGSGDHGAYPKDGTIKRAFKGLAVQLAVSIALVLGLGMWALAANVERTVLALASSPIINCN